MAENDGFSIEPARRSGVQRRSGTRPGQEPGQRNNRPRLARIHLRRRSHRLANTRVHGPLHRLLPRPSCKRTGPAPGPAPATAGSSILKHPRHPIETR